MNGVRRVVCGISGGVDSAVAAFLLKKKGYDVVGLFMKNWDIRDEMGKCTVDDDREDAEYVCKSLEIPLYEVDFVKQYWHEVFSHLVKDYESGVTPNPDILCNRHIKFNHFIKHAQSKLDAQAVATGHYARTSVGYNLDKVDQDIGVSLMCAEDEVKDQTFFLSQIPQWALQKTIFPLGDLMKSSVKQIASTIGMDRIAKKKESMGICFIGSRNFHNFIEEYIEPKEGNFIDVETGSVLGRHKGTHLWTLGQRARIGGRHTAYYVCELRPDTQDVIVAPGTDHPALFSQTFYTDEIHWINRPPPATNTSPEIKTLLSETETDNDNNLTSPIDINTQGIYEGEFRFQHVHPLMGCLWSASERGGFKVKVDMPMRALTCGQYAVFYKNNECLGSGRIVSLGRTLYDMNVRDKVVFPKQYS